MDDDTFNPSFWGRMFIISVVVFVLVAGAALLDGHSLTTALTLAIWGGPGYIVAMFFAAIVWWFFKR